MDLLTIIFMIFAGLTVGSAAMVLVSKDIVRSAVFLAASFLGVAITYLFLNSEYLFLIQVLVYVGAINVLILFGIMLTRRRMISDSSCQDEESGRWLQ